MLSYILSIGALIATGISMLLSGKGMKKILVMLALGNLMMAFSYVCTGALSGFITAVIATVQTVINYFFDVKGKRIPVYLLVIYALSFIVINLCVYVSLVDLLAIAASVSAVIVTSRKNGKTYRIWASINNILWCTYDVLKGSYGPLVTHVVLLGCTIAGIIIHDLKKEKIPQ